MPYTSSIGLEALKKKVKKNMNEERKLPKLGVFRQTSYINYIDFSQSQTFPAPPHQSYVVCIPRW